MIRILRGLIYGIAAGIAAAFVIDYLDNKKQDASAPQLPLSTGSKQPSEAEADPNENLSSEARQALLDELGAQL